MPSTISRRFALGAELTGEGQAHFRVWAPKAKRLDVVLEASADDDPGRTFHPLTAEVGGYFAGFAPADAGTLYRFRVNESNDYHPDPASRYQPEGPHRSSCVVDPAAFRWTDANWAGIKLPGQVIYEMHIGTFTPEGTWRAAARHLPDLVATGITAIEMMPVADFAGEFGWGYDGVNLFAPTRLYGTPEDLRAFIDVAHSLGLGVILDVVYNHFGPEGNYLRVFSDDYFTERHENDWGDSIAFDGPKSAPVREFFVSNARYWIEEFHFDGFRFDATQDIHDNSEVHILAEIGLAARKAAGQRRIVLIAENEPQQSRLVRSVASGGAGLDGLWNDDWHHSAVVALTGRNEAYYSDYTGQPQEFISAAKYGYLFQGQYYTWQKKARGQAALDIPPAAFVAFIENHDQVSNSIRGARLRQQCSPGRYRAVTALLLLGPWTPMLFQGQEYGATTPFTYFCDVSGELGEAVCKGRFEFLAQFPSIAGREAQAQLPRPSDPDTFASCKLDRKEAAEFPEIALLHRDLLRLRKEDPCFREQKPRGLDGAVLTDDAFALRYFGPDGDDRLLVINYGKRTSLHPLPEPLLAPPRAARWEILWNSESICYGGQGPAQLITDEGWILPDEAAVVLHPIPSSSAIRELP